eukprot:COSAG06_NODE_880_length_11804_cov_13.493721_6_plen_43_part_00
MIIKKQMVTMIGFNDRHDFVCVWLRQARGTQRMTSAGKEFRE